MPHMCRIGSVSIAGTLCWCRRRLVIKVLHSPPSTYCCAAQRSNQFSEISRTLVSALPFLSLVFPSILVVILLRACASVYVGACRLGCELDIEPVRSDPNLEQHTKDPNPNRGRKTIPHHATQRTGVWLQTGCARSSPEEALKNI